MILKVFSNKNDSTIPNVRNRTLRYRLLLILYLFLCRTRQMVLLVKLALAAQRGNMPKLHTEAACWNTGLWLALHCLFLLVPSFSTNSSVALPAHPKLPSGKQNLGLLHLLLSCFLPRKCFLVVHLPDYSMPANCKHGAGKGEPAEGPDVLALPPLQLPSQWQNQTDPKWQGSYNKQKNRL